MSEGLSGCLTGLDKIQNVVFKFLQFDLVNLKMMKNYCINATQMTPVKQRGSPLFL